jgi:putative polyhydroxyalkanoate system protein
MADIHVVRPHALGREEARRRVDQVIEGLQHKYPLTTAWLDEDHLSLKAAGVDGEVAVTDDAIEVTITLGFMASMFKDTIEGEIASAFGRGLA